MSAQELRKAAETLRERANAATLGPWTHYSDMWNGMTPVHRIGSNAASADVGLTPREPVHNGLADAAYIATMHPGVGLALADWLDYSARGFDAVGGPSPDHEDAFPMIRLARLINGGAS